jgi:hypothetical protein
MDFALPISAPTRIVLTNTCAPVADCITNAGVAKMSARPVTSAGTIERGRNRSFALFAPVMIGGSSEGVFDRCANETAHLAQQKKLHEFLGLL